MIAPDNQLASLMSPLGEHGSGRVRYAAAMYFFAQGAMPPAVLEIYRRCINLDSEDPVDLARFEGLSIPPLLTQQTQESAP